MANEAKVLIPNEIARRIFGFRAEVDKLEQKRLQLHAAEQGVIKEKKEMQAQLNDTLRSLEEGTPMPLFDDGEGEAPPAEEEAAK